MTPLCFAPQHDQTQHCMLLKATVAAFRGIVGWNSKHIVHFAKTPSKIPSTSCTVMVLSPSTRRRWSSPMKKKFDCVDMQHAGGRRIYNRLKGRTVEEQAQFWKQRTAELLRRQRRLQAHQPTVCAA